MVTAGSVSRDAETTSSGKTEASPKFDSTGERSVFSRSRLPSAANGCHATVTDEDPAEPPTTTTDVTALNSDGSRRKLSR